MMKLNSHCEQHFMLEQREYRSSPSARSRWRLAKFCLCLLMLTGSKVDPATASDSFPLTLGWKENFLTIEGDELPGDRINVLYMEAYCRANSHTAPWDTHTVIGHRTQLIHTNRSRTRIVLKCTLSDGVIIDHVITAKKDEVEFRLFARNPTQKVSDAQWAQPCVRVGEFTGLGDPANAQSYSYLKKSFVFLDGRLSMMPTKDWALKARYVPGQVWAAPGVSAFDVNPRPLNPNPLSNGLIGCFSADDKMLFATAWEPYQELFQGVITCLHSDFRIGGLNPGETKRIRGKIYVLRNNIPALLKRYVQDFPDSPHFPNLSRPPLQTDW